MYDMTNKELAREVARRTGVTPYQAQKIISAMADVVNENVANGDGVKIAGVGTISVRTAKARRSRSIADGSPIVIPEHDAVRFRAARRLRLTIDGRNEDGKDGDGNR